MTSAATRLDDASFNADMPMMRQRTVERAVSDFLARLGARGAALDESGCAALHLDDGATLVLECAEEDLLIVLASPERHPDAQALARHLWAVDCRHDWPLPVAAGVSEQDARPLLITRLATATLDIEALELAWLTLRRVAARR
jgi:type III secretion system chaperone SycN